jgi:type I restriction enzyme S subunit
MAKTYESYKDSGIAWIGEIPSEWKVEILSMHLYEHRLYNTELKETNLLSLSYGNIVKKNIDTKEGLLPESFNHYNIIDEGDIVLRLTDLQNDKRSLRTGLCKEHGIITSAYLTLRNRGNDNSDYLHYLLHAYDLCKVFYGMGNGVRQGMNFSDMRKLELIIPPFSEQQSIASFLDTKCGEIDSLISLQEEMISELQAYKQSVITEAVTKGLDPNAKMNCCASREKNDACISSSETQPAIERKFKDSGVEWIGEIPEGWKTNRLKYLCSIATGNKDTQDSEEDGIYKFYVRSPIIEHSNSWTFEGEGILMAGDGAGAGRVFHHAFGKYAVHQRVYRMADFKSINTNFLYYYLSSLFCRIMDMGSAQSTVPSVRLPMLTNFVICIPPLSEQQSIATYLDAKTSQIDSLITLKQQKIDELKDYKKSIIYEYVTGKKRV